MGECRRHACCTQFVGSAVQVAACAAPAHEKRVGVGVAHDFEGVIVAELNSGMMADWLQCHFPDINIRRINKVQGQPFLVGELVEGVKNIVNE